MYSLILCYLTLYFFVHKSLIVIIICSVKPYFEIKYMLTCNLSIIINIFSVNISKKKIQKAILNMDN